jgi:DNA polymerase-3 subunit delta'
MGFNRITGHQETIGLLRMAMNRQRLAHGYIFEGVPGSGRRLVAQELAKALLCESKGDEGCGHCASCLKFETSNHPDYLEIAPDGKSVKVEQIEALQSFVMVRPYSSDRKVVVVDDAETMTASAQNRLLKLIEEPPAYATLIFITALADALLPTILSRCQIITFSRLGPGIISEWLIHERHIDETTALTASKFSGGSIGRALMLATSPQFSETRQDAIEMIGALTKRDPVEAFLKLQKYSTDKVLATSLTDLMIIWYRDLSALSIDPENAVIFSQDQRLDLLELQNRTQKTAWIDCLEIVEETARALDENANTSLALYAMALRIQEVFHDNSRRGPV